MNETLGTENVVCPNVKHGVQQNVVLNSQVARHKGSAENVVLNPQVAIHKGSAENVALNPQVAIHKGCAENVVLNPQVAIHKGSAENAVLNPQLAGHSSVTKCLWRCPHDSALGSLSSRKSNNRGFCGEHLVQQEHNNNNCIDKLNKA